MYKSDNQPIPGDVGFASGCAWLVLPVVAGLLLAYVLVWHTLIGSRPSPAEYNAAFLNNMNNGETPLILLCVFVVSFVGFFFSVSGWRRFMTGRPNTRRTRQWNATLAMMLSGVMVAFIIMCFLKW